MTDDADGDIEMIELARSILGYSDHEVEAAIRDSKTPWKTACIIALIALREAKDA